MTTSASPDTNPSPDLTYQNLCLHIQEGLTKALVAQGFAAPEWKATPGGSFRYCYPTESMTISLDRATDWQAKPVQDTVVIRLRLKVYIYKAGPMLVSYKKTKNGTWNYKAVAAKARDWENRITAEDEKVQEKDRQRKVRESVIQTEIGLVAPGVGMIRHEDGTYSVSVNSHGLTAAQAKAINEVLKQNYSF